MSEQGKIISFPETRGRSHEVSRVAPQEVLERRYESVVIVPYSSNLYDHGPKRGTPHLSLFSALATIAAVELYEAGLIDNILLCGETTFGEEDDSTTYLMVEKLYQLDIPAESIRIVEANNLNNTAFQIEALAKRQRMHQRPQPYLLVDWEFHDQRVRTNAKAYGLNADTISVEDTLSYFFPHFNSEKYRAILEDFARKESFLRLVSSVDRKGYVNKIYTRATGPFVTDVQVLTNKKGGKYLNLLTTRAINRAKKVNSQS